MISDIEDFFTLGCGRCDRFGTPDCSTRLWIGGLNKLRRICRDMGLQETVKWGHPCYMHAGRNIVLVGALRGDFRLNFFNAALMKDPDGVMEKQGAEHGAGGFDPLYRCGPGGRAGGDHPRLYGRGDGIFRGGDQGGAGGARH